MVNTESAGLNPNWLGEINLLSVKKLTSSVQMRRSKFLLQIESKEIGQWFFRNCWPPFLWTGTTWAFSQSAGSVPFFSQSLKIVNRGLQFEFPTILSFLYGAYRDCRLFLRSKLFVILEMPSNETLTKSSDLLVNFARLLG